MWGLDIIFGNLIMSHNDGAFLIESNKATKISKYNGSWKFIEFGDNNFVWEELTPDCMSSGK